MDNPVSKRPTYPQSIAGRIYSQRLHQARSYPSPILPGATTCRGCHGSGEPPERVPASDRKWWRGRQGWSDWAGSAIGGGSSSGSTSGNNPSGGTPSGGTSGASAATTSGTLGSLSEKYESGGRGSSTVGYDSTGGTSYGKYQIASKVGAMDDYL